MRKNAQAVARRNRLILSEREIKGKLIVIEGNDGSGKSTAAKYLNKYLNGQGINSKILKFNMSYVTIKSIKLGKRKLFGPISNSLLHATSIIDQFERYALYELVKGNTIICDRYIYSVIARGIARGVDESNICSLENWVLKPDIVLFLDIPPNIALSRIGTQNVTFWEAGKDMIYNADTDTSFLEFQSRVRETFFALCHKMEICNY